MGVDCAAFIPLAAALDPQNEHKYQLKLDEELTNALHEATAKKVTMATPLVRDPGPQIHCPMQRSFGMYHTIEVE